MFKRLEATKKNARQRRTVENTRDLAKQGADPLGAFGHLNVQELFDGQRIA